MSVTKYMNMKSIAVIFVIGVFIGGGYYLCHKQKDPEPEVLPVVKAGTKVVAEGKVIPVNYSVLSFPVSGIVSEVLVKEGDKVEAGQVLVRLECQELHAQYQQAVAKAAKAKANHHKTGSGLRPQEIRVKQAIVQQKQASYERAKADCERAEQLYQVDAVSRQELDRYKTTYLNEQANLRQAETEYEMGQIGSREEDVEITAAELIDAQALLDETAARIAQTELRAPFRSTVTSIDLKVGQLVTTDTDKVDENAEISDNIKIHLADTTKWLIRTNDLTEISVVSIKEGAPVTITFPGIPGLELPGKVVRIKEYGEKRRGDMTYAVLVEPLDFDERLKWNMTAFVSIETGNEDLAKTID